MSNSNNNGCGCVLWIVIILVILLISNNIKKQDTIEQMDNRIEQLENK